MAAGLLGASSLFAQVPQLINYQGRVAVSGTNFSGTGQFKFALVNAAGTTSYWSNNNSSVAGAQPTAAVSLTVTAAPGATINFTDNITNRGTRTWGANDYLSFRDVDNTFLGFPSISGVSPGSSKTVAISIVAFFAKDDTLVLCVQ